MTNYELIENFYTSFKAGDVEKMLESYDKNIIFKDPAFGQLRGQDVRDMWRMLLSQKNNEPKIMFMDIKAGDKKGSAYWEAEYIFSQTGRKVVNKISARFRFSDGKIIKHTDSFDLWDWTAQALGWKGYLLGWSTFMKRKIRKQTTELLIKYQMNKNKLKD